MGTHGWIGLILLVASVLLLFVQHLKMNRERDRPTLRHALVASYLNSCRLPHTPPDHRRPSGRSSLSLLLRSKPKTSLAKSSA
jgi:hypothetical protein